MKAPCVQGTYINSVKHYYWFLLKWKMILHRAGSSTELTITKSESESQCCHVLAMTWEIIKGQNAPPQNMLLCLVNYLELKTIGPSQLRKSFLSLP